MKHLSQLLMVVSLASIHAASASVQEKLNGPVTDFIHKQFTYHRLPFSADLSKTVSYVKVDGSNHHLAPIVIVPGRGSHAFFWAETIFDLRGMGFSGDIYVWDAPGQGQSDRLLPSHALVGQIAKFSDYTDSFAEFLELVNRNSPEHKPRVLGHSMGGAIVLATAEQRPELFNSVVALAPMLDIRFGRPVLDFAFTSLILALGSSGLGDQFAIGSEAAREILPNEADLSRTDRVRFCWRMEDEFNVRLPGQTLQWISQAIRGGAKTVANAHKITIPTKIYIAENDVILDNRAAALFVSRCPKYCSLETVAHGLHTMVEDYDSVRTPLLNSLAEWLHIYDKSH